MGSSGSKQNAKVESSSLQSRHSVNDETQISDSPSEQNGKTVSRSSEMKSGCCQVSDKCFRTDSADQSDDMNCTTSDTEFGESSFIDNVHRESNTSSRHFASRSLNPRSRFVSRFSFYPRNLSFRFKKANSLDSTRADSSSSTSYTISNEEENHAIQSTSLVNNNDRPQGCDFFPTCFSSRSLRMRRENRASNDFVSSPDIFDSSQQSRQINSGNNVVMDTNVRFSRTMSVGRLRDRVLRRMPVADSDLYNFQLEREVRLTGRVNGTVEDTPYNANFHQPDSSDNISSYGRQNYIHETPRGRETRHHDLLENRSNFIERRRRIRSQVRALQLLGSHFENLPAHERSCALSSQQRQGQCTCRAVARDANPNDNNTAGASISRIVMLAEALFEVLDEIHQQSVVLSSRSSVSSVGLIPAPNEVVDSLPLKIFSALKKKPSEEATQCYICLVEYEEGDSIRMLPCHHEFHRVCVDKWLKEVHRYVRVVGGTSANLNYQLKEVDAILFALSHLERTSSSWRTERSRNLDCFEVYFACA